MKRTNIPIQYLCIYSVLLKSNLGEEACLPSRTESLDLSWLTYGSYAIYGQKWEWSAMRWDWFWWICLAWAWGIYTLVLFKQRFHKQALSGPVIINKPIAKNAARIAKALMSIYKSSRTHCEGQGNLDCRSATRRYCCGRGAKTIWVSFTRVVREFLHDAEGDSHNVVSDFWCFFRTIRAHF